MEQYYEKDKLELGIDEAGRGCLFGPVSVAGVIWLDEEPDPSIEIKDSKKLSLKKRLLAYDYILDNSISYSHVFIHHDDIDKDNILKQLSDDDVHLYDEKKNQYDLAFAMVTRKSCSNCFSGLPPQLFINVIEGKKLEVCPSCNIFLYIDDENIDL